MIQPLRCAVETCKAEMPLAPKGRGRPRIYHSPECRKFAWAHPASFVGLVHRRCEFRLVATAATAGKGWITCWACGETDPRDAFLRTNLRDP